MVHMCTYDLLITVLQPGPPPSPPPQQVTMLHTYTPEAGTESLGYTFASKGDVVTIVNPQPAGGDGTWLYIKRRDGSSGCVA